MKKSNGTVETSTLGQLTEKEIIFLQQFGKSDFYDGIDSSVWDYSVNENLPYKGKTRSGVISSLEQKGIIWVQKKEKGDIAGFYTLTDEAINSTYIKSIVEGTKEEVEKPEDKISDVANEGDEHVSVIESTWKKYEMVEQRSFEKRYLQILGEIHSCEVSRVRNKETDHDSYIIVGKPEGRENLIKEYEENLPIVRVESHKHYLSSDRTLSEFRFTTAYQTSFLNSLQ